MKKLILISAMIMASSAIAGPAKPAGQKSTMSEKNAELLAKRLKGRTVSEPVRCVSQNRVGQPVIYGNQTILYSGSGRTEYLNNLPSRCPGLDDDDLIIFKRSGSQVCEGDPIEPVDRFSGFSGPVCRLGPFIPYTKPKKGI